MRETRRTSQPGMLFDVRLRLTVAAVLMAVTSGLIIAFVLWPSVRTELTFAAAVIGGGATVYYAYYVAADVRLGLRRDQVHRVFDFAEVMASGEISRTRMHIARLLDQEKLAPAVAFDAIVADEDLQISTRTLLNLMESISIAVKSDYADEALAFEFFGEVLPIRSREPRRIYH